MPAIKMKPTALPFSTFWRARISSDANVPTIAKSAITSPSCRRRLDDPVAVTATGGGYAFGGGYCCGYCWGYCCGGGYCCGYCCGGYCCGYCCGGYCCGCC